MTEFEKVIYSISKKSLAILDGSIPFGAYTPIDLSVNNREIEDLDISKPGICQNYIDRVLKRESARVAFGGYLEERNLYNVYPNFQKEKRESRNIHLGMDFWTPAGTAVLSVLDGRVHSFKNNSQQGDYGPTIILEHHAFQRRFYTLYGHLALSSLRELYPGKVFHKGEVVGTLGETEINVNYAPHLHFQIIADVGGYQGDFPGVAGSSQLENYKLNCPDPNLLLKLPASNR